MRNFIIHSCLVSASTISNKASSCCSSISPNTHCANQLPPATAANEPPGLCRKAAEPAVDAENISGTTSKEQSENKEKTGAGHW